MSQLNEIKKALTEAETEMMSAQSWAEEDGRLAMASDIATMVEELSTLISGL